MNATHSAERVLIVEDEAFLNEAYTTILRKEGYIVDTAFNGKEAIECVKTNVPALILLDLRMPIMNGVEFLKQLPDSVKKVTKIVVFSNYDVQKEIDEAFSLGAVHYLLKAWASPKELARVVSKTLKATTVN